MVKQMRMGHLILVTSLLLLCSLVPVVTEAGGSLPRLATPTSVSVMASPTTVVEGQTIQVTVTVTGSSGTPTGTVQVVDAIQSICAITLSGGTGTCSTPLFAVANPTYQIYGVYSGDDTYSGTTGTTTLDLEPAPTSTSLVASSTSPQKFSTVYLTATVSDSAPYPPPGDLVAPVVFIDNGEPITGLPSCDGIEGSAGPGPYSVVCTINAIAPGTHVYQAQYQGTSMLAVSTSSQVTVSSSATPTTVSGGSDTAFPTVGQKITLVASVLADGPTAQGEITFSIGGVVLCTAGISAGTTACSTSAEPAGIDTVTVSFDDPSGVFEPSSSTFVLDVRGLSSAVGMAANRTGSGYWIADARGGVAAFGAAVNYGSMSGTPLNAPIAHIVSTPDGLGYWLVAADGGTFSFGDAQFYGSMGGKALNAPVVAIAPTADGRGYWLVASDGGIFAFGDAAFHGSMGGTHLNRPVVGIVADDATSGYWEVATDGGIFAFNSPFFGSTGNINLNEPVNGMASTADDRGYTFVASDGGIFTYGDAGYFGSMGGTKLAAPIEGMAPDWTTGGYWLVGADGGIFSFNAPFFGA